MAETENKTNARRFLDAYNNIDYTLKARYNLNRAMGFSDLIRKTVPLNYIVRKYEDELVDFGRLRNAIIHNNSEHFVIAEPHDSVVEELEHIERLLTKPLKALDTVAKKDVFIIYAGKSMRDVIILMANTNYSNLPVYKDNDLIGVANGQKIINMMGKYLASGGKCVSFLDNVKIEDMLSSLDNSNYYVVKDKDCTLEQALTEFDKNHKLLAILFTKTGKNTEFPIGIMTGLDVVEAQKILDNY